MDEEATIQLLCKNGHLLLLYRHIQDVDYKKKYDPSKFDKLFSCKICGEGRVWSNAVQSCDFYSYGHIKLKEFRIIDKELITENVDIDGIWITVTQETHAVYRIPPKDTPRYKRTSFSNEVIFNEVEEEMESTNDEAS